MTTKQASSATPEKRRAGLAHFVLFALVAGIACGLFFGEYCSILQIWGDAFVALLQTTVLPYIVLALIVNIGSLNTEGAKGLAAKAALVVVALWTVGLALIFLIPLGLPSWNAASFFSTSLVQPREEIDFLKLYIPSNPFHSLSQNLVPAVVLFSISVGAAVIGLSEKDALLRPARVLLDGLGRVARLISNLTPFGVFALAASAAGTITLQEAERIQGYVILFVAGALLMTFVVLPAALASFTPFGIREVLSKSKDALITAFATDNVFIVLPQLVQGCKDLFRDRFGEDETVERAVDVAIPLAYPFPHLGRLLALVFIPFAAWYVGRNLDLGDYLVVAVSGLMSLFAAVTIALPFLLDLMELPSDLFHLFLLAGLVCARFGSLVGAMHLFTFSTLTAAAMSGRLKPRSGPLLGSAVALVLVVGITIAGSRQYLANSLANAPQASKLLTGMALEGNPAPSVLVETISPNPVPLRQDQSRLSRIQERGVIRIGVFAGAMPFVFFNDAGDLVGFDIEVAHKLASDIGTSVEFVLLTDPSTAFEQLGVDHCDLIMTGIIGTAGRYAEAQFTDPHLDAAPALVVPDHRRQEFDTPEKVTGMPELRLAVVNEQNFLNLVKAALPNATVIPMNDMADFFEDRLEGADAMVTVAEVGAAWTLLYPHFQVVVPWKPRPKWPIAYPVGGRDLELTGFLNNWLALQRRNGWLDEVYDHWILGRTARPPSKRWSIIRDVLHWVD